MLSIFVSYRRDDSAHQAGRIHDRLVAHFGAAAVFKDVNSIRSGQDFREALNRHLARADVFLAVIGDHWLDILDKDGKRRLDDPADYVRMEIEAALGRKIPVIPVLVGKAAMPEPEQLPEGMRGLPFQQGNLVRPDPDFHQDMDRLIRGIESYRPRRGEFGRFRIVRRLGGGGAGSVFLADDPRINRRVALKIPEFGPDHGPGSRTRFKAEARSVAEIEHPNLCPVLDVGEVGIAPYLTMEYIEGKSLADTLTPDGLPPRQVGALVGKLAIALDHAHKRGAVHRSLKTSNIRFRSTGLRRGPVIVGFGHAHGDCRTALRLARSDQITSGIAYLAPEQVRGDPAEVGPAVDLYAMGVILHELLTGRLPFVGSGLSIANQILNVEPDPPSTINHGLDPLLDAICRKAMAKSVERRYRSMGELALAIGSFLRSPDASSRP